MFQEQLHYQNTCPTESAKQKVFLLHIDKRKQKNNCFT